MTDLTNNLNSMSAEPPSALTLLAAMRRITAQGHYGMSLQDLCDATGQTRMSVSRWLYRLESDGKAFSDGKGGALRYYLFADAREPLSDEREQLARLADVTSARTQATR